MPLRISCVQGVKWNILKLFKIIFCTKSLLPWQFHENPFTRFSVKTDKHTNQARWKYNLRRSAEVMRLRDIAQVLNQTEFCMVYPLYVAHLVTGVVANLMNVRFVKYTHTFGLRFGSSEEIATSYLYHSFWLNYIHGTVHSLHFEIIKDISKGHRIRQVVNSISTNSRSYDAWFYFIFKWDDTDNIHGKMWHKGTR